MKRLVDSNIFQRGILVAILINTLSMGIEHHNQVTRLLRVVLLLTLFLYHQLSAKLECTYRVRTHAVLFLSVSPSSEWQWSAIVVRNEVLLCNVIDPVTLTFNLSIPKPCHLLVYSKVIPYIKFEHFGSLFFELCCGQTDKQTNRQTNRRSRSRASVIIHWRVKADVNWSNVPSLRSLLVVEESMRSSGCL